MTICILGRQPKLGLTELEAQFGAKALTLLSPDVVLVDDKVDITRFGGIIKTADYLTTVDSTELTFLTRFCKKALPEHVGTISEGKIKFGLSFYGYDFSPHRIGAAGLELKKVIRALGRSVRVVPNTEAALSSAQVLHNQLTSPLGLELVFVKHDKKTYLGQTDEIQNIEDYTLRDRGRPKRDAYVGMLPPKLAQIMINLTSRSRTTPVAPGFEGSAFPAERGDIAGELESSTPEKSGVTGVMGKILDPFCGTGVVLQEAALMGYSVYGSDNSQRMVDYSETNLEWLRRTYDLSFDSTLETGDATTHTWTEAFSGVVTETYLGQPLLALPDRQKLQTIISGCDKLHKDFLANLATQVPSGTRMCLAVPAWKTPAGFLHLKTLDDLEDLGYNRLDFVHAKREDLIYHREDQIVARELVIITRK